MRRLFFLIVSISLAVPAISQSKHPLTFEDMMKLKRVGEPEVSLDGKWVIFSVVDVDLDANTKTPHIWIVPATLVIHGQRDYKIDVSQAFQLFTTLQMLGVPSKMLYFSDEAQYPNNPQNSQLWYKTANDWVDQWTMK
jgi:dipeptidyl aminopeptidase/acylaminoacyl peptidase